MNPPALLARRRRLPAVMFAATLLGGCANLAAVSEFAADTGKLTGTVRGELARLDDLCTRQAELVIVVNNLPDDGPLADCRRYQAAEGRLAGVTLDVLDNYAHALGALTDDKSFDVSPDLKDVAGKLQGLKTRSGAALVDGQEVAALSTLVDALFDVATSARRDAAVRRLVDQAPNLATTGKVLRSFFVAASDAPPGRVRPPYANLVAVIDSSVTSTQALLRSPAMRQAEPIRTAELLRDLDGRRQALAPRSGSVPAAVAAAIDAWQETLQKFADEALKPDPRNLRDRLQHLRQMTEAARAALGELRH